MSRLHIENLERDGLAPVSLNIEAGQCVCVSGPSGAGKSLLLRTLADLDPHHGEVYLDDIACSAINAPQWRQQVGLLPAESQWWHDQVAEHFPYIDQDQWQQLGFGSEVGRWAVARLSTGERQRLALLRLLSYRPKALLLDEPTASLDPESVKCAEALIQDYRTQNNVPTLWISHDPQQIQRVADRQFQMISGQLQACP